MTAAPRTSQVPVVLLTGFLGSGKTTLLNRLLAARQARVAAGPDPDRAGKLAILVNELGAIGIDGSLLPAGSARQVELAGGCICCTLDENLEKSLGDLVDAEPDIELCVIETTGIAEPLPIVWTMAGEALAPRVRLLAVVTVVDSLEHERHRPLAPAVDAQVDQADLLVVSKLDLLDPGAAAARLAELEVALRRDNPHAVILAERDPSAAAGALLDVLSDPSIEAAGARRGAALAPAREHARANDHGHRHGFDSVVVPIEGTLDFEELTSALEELPPEYVRIKGIARAIDRSTGSDEPRSIAFHRVGARVSAEPLPAGAEASAPRVVALGFGVQAGPLAACVRAAMIRS